MSNNRTNRSFRNDRPEPRMVATKVVNSGDPARQKVFTLGAPKVVLIKVQTKRNLGLPKQVPPTEAQQAEKQAKVLAAAEKLGVDVDAYIDNHQKQHTGTKPIDGETRVRLDLVVAELLTAGYKLTQAVWFQKPAQGGRTTDPVQQLTFSLEGEAIEMTDLVKAFIAEVYVDGFHVWCNPRLEDDSMDRFYRLDTLNGFERRPKNPAADPGQRLRYAAPADGKSGYDLVSSLQDDEIDE